MIRNYKVGEGCVGHLFAFSSLSYFLGELAFHTDRKRGNIVAGSSQFLSQDGWDQGEKPWALD